MKKKILITGAAGFIGFQLCQQLLEKGCSAIWRIEFKQIG